VVYVHYSRVPDAPVGDVREVVSDFASLPRWCPFIDSSDLSEGGGPKQVGTVRTNHFNDGTVGEEKLTELSDRDRRVVYDIIGGDLRHHGRRRRSSRLGPHRDLPDLPGRARARSRQAWLGT
jgi:hypothetical protein